VDGNERSLNQRMLALLRRVEWSADPDGVFWCLTCDAERAGAPPGDHAAGCEVAALIQELQAAFELRKL
jgi:hypothetical protein